MTNSRSIGYIFAAALALAAVGNAQVDEVTTNEASFAEAVAFVQSFSSETGDGGSACEKVANDSIKVITDACADVQKDLDALADSNKDCCTSGEISLCAAKNAHLSSKGKGDKCRAEAGAIENHTVDLGKVSLKTLNQATDQCFNFQNVGGYKTLKEKHTSKIKACLVAKGKTEGLKTFLDDAVKDAAIARTKCVTSLSTKLDEAYTSGASKCGSEANKVAYKRAEHMKCVLAGTKLADCKLDKMPTVTKPTPATLVCKPSSGDSCLKVWVTYRDVKMYKVQVLSKFGSMYNKNNKNGTPSFIDACGTYGLKPVCERSQAGVCNGQCVCVDRGGPQSGLHFSEPSHCAAKGFPPSKAAGIYWFTGNNKPGALLNTGSTHRWVRSNDKNGYTMCA